MLPVLDVRFVKLFPLFGCCFAATADDYVFVVALAAFAPDIALARMLLLPGVLTAALADVF